MKIMSTSYQRKKLNKETLIKYYDLIKIPTRCVIEKTKVFKVEHEDKKLCIYFTVNAIVGSLIFPSSEIFYFQQQQ